MQRVYLDQNKWIDLARTVGRTRKVRHYPDAVAVLASGVSLGLVSVVLSNVHYRETARNRNERQRHDLARLMLSLSNRHTIAPLHEVVRAELDLAMAKHYGRPETPRQVQVFGVGACHAVGNPRFTPRRPAGMPDEVWYPLRERALAGFEYACLAGLPADGDPEWSTDGFEEDAQRAARYAAGQQADKARLQTGSWHKGERGKRRALANTLIGFTESVTEAMVYAGVTKEEFMDAGRDVVQAFCEDVPMIFVDSELERVQNASCREWEPNDLNDLDALMRAIVYCDVVVAEKFWISAAKQARLDQKYGTVLLTSLDGLAKHLAASS
jgi:hypothetical protein